MRCGEAWANALGTKSAEVPTASAAALPASNCRRLIPVTMLGHEIRRGRPLVDCSMQHLRIPALPSNDPLTCARCEDQAAAQEEGDVCTRNRTMTGVAFLFRVTLRWPEIADEIEYIPEPQKIPLVLSPAEVRRLLDAAPGFKCRLLLSLAYGCGLRASEVGSLKVCGIDSPQMVIRIEQVKGRKDRYVMLSPDLLAMLRQWWKAARPQGWLFPGR